MIRVSEEAVRRGAANGIWRNRMNARSRRSSRCRRPCLTAPLGVLFLSILVIPAALHAPRANASPTPPPETFPVPAHMGLTLGGKGELLLDGKPYRGIGVDYYSLFSSLLADPSSTAYVSGLRQLESHHIPFVRFMATGFWPSDLRLLESNPHEYWRLMGDVVAEAQRDHIGLIADFFWTTFTVPDLVGEPLDQWGNPASKTIRFMKSYVAQFMMRFDRSPAIWGYEFGNEYNNAADLPNWRSHLAPVSPKRGTPTDRTAADRLTSAEVIVAYKAFAQEIRKFDPYRIIESGNSIDRISAWHQKYRRSWGTDSESEYASMLRYLNPRPFGMTSVHFYPGRKLLPPFKTAGAYLSFLNGLARTNGRPLFIGEFGVPGRASAAKRQEFRSLLEAVIGSGAPLAALWVYDDPKLPTWNATFSNGRAYQLLEVAQADASLDGAPKPSP